jgi:hypothetical protein
MRVFGTRRQIYDSPLESQLLVLSDAGSKQLLGTQARAARMHTHTSCTRRFPCLTQNSLHTTSHHVTPRHTTSRHITRHASHYPRAGRRPRGLLAQEGLRGAAAPGAAARERRAAGQAAEHAAGGACPCVRVCACLCVCVRYTRGADACVSMRTAWLQPMHKPRSRALVGLS